MSWSAITEADLLNHISGTELTALRAAALKAGQVDPVTPSITQVTDLVRGYIAACTRNHLPTDATTIPSRLLAPACDILVSVIIARIPGYPLAENRKDARNAAISLLEQVAACKYAIEDATSGSDGGGQFTQVSSQTRRATRAKMEGL